MPISSTLLPFSPPPLSAPLLPFPSSVQIGIDASFISSA